MGSRRDGMLRKPVTIRAARVGDDLYVRSHAGATPPGSAAPKSATKAER
jgi:hypothetical protein